MPRHLQQRQLCPVLGHRRTGRVLAVHGVQAAGGPGVAVLATRQQVRLLTAHHLLIYRVR